MDDQLLMRGLHRLGGGGEEGDARGQRRFGRGEVDRAAVDIFHDQIGRAVVGDPAVDEPGDAGVLQLGEDLALAHEAGGGQRRQMGVQQLNRHPLFVEAVVADRAPDLAHAALADLLEQAERPDPVGGLGGRRGQDFGDGRQRAPPGLGASFQGLDAMEHGGGLAP